MNLEIESILNLQKIDLDIIKENNEIEKMPLELKELSDKKIKIQEELKEFEDKVKKQLLKQKETESQIDDAKSKLQKYEFQLNSVKTNDEYSKVLKEISGVKQNIKDIEDSLLNLMETTENFESERANKKKYIMDETAIIDAEIKEKNNILNNMKSTLQSLKVKRDEVSKQCDGVLYSKYEKFMEKKKSIALVPVEPNGTCGGCHRNLPPNIRNEVMKGKIIQCDNCSRLLFWIKEEKDLPELNT